MVVAGEGLDADLQPVDDLSGATRALAVDPDVGVVRVGGEERRHRIPVTQEVRLPVAFDDLAVLRFEGSHRRSLADRPPCGPLSGWRPLPTTSPPKRTRSSPNGISARLSTLRADGTLHVCAVGFTWDPERTVVRVITSDGSQKVRNVERSGRAAVGQVDGGRWLSLEGPARVTRDPDDSRRRGRPLHAALPGAARQPGAGRDRDPRRTDPRPRLTGTRRVRRARARRAARDRVRPVRAPPGSRPSTRQAAGAPSGAAVTGPRRTRRSRRRAGARAAPRR